MRLVPFYYLNFKNPLFLVKTVLLAAQTLVGDCVLVRAHHFLEDVIVRLIPRCTIYSFSDGRSGDATPYTINVYGS